MCSKKIEKKERKGHQNWQTSSKPVDSFGAWTELGCGASFSLRLNYTVMEAGLSPKGNRHPVSKVARSSKARNWGKAHVSASQICCYARCMA
jgi:hypothetical protein